MNAPTKPTLVIMAAGMGSRFGGLKQIAPVDDRGQLIIDYSIFDAIRAGFERVVIIVRAQNEAAFHEAIGKRIAPLVDLQYVHQELSTLPEGYLLPEGRVKPWGTAHAILCCKDVIHEPFAAINADDFYGRDSFASLAEFLKTSVDPTEHAMVGFQLENTLTEFGTVARGVCKVKDSYLTGITERTAIEKCATGAQYIEEGVAHPLPLDTTVSMNLWGFKPSILPIMGDRFSAFLDENLKTNPLKCEYFLPSIPNQLIHEGLARVRVLNTQSRWYGMTYREDAEFVQNSIAKLVQAGEYPKALWK